MPNAQLFKKLNQLIQSGPFEVHVARIFSLEQAAEAHRALDQHYLGKLALRTSKQAKKSSEPTSTQKQFDVTQALGRPTFV
jgi:Zinc-binding dehydrogenase